MPHVTFIHGIANKPDPEVLTDNWRRSLADDGGLNLGAKGVTSSMVYWADVMYASPAEEDEAHESVGHDAITSETDEGLEWREELQEEEEKGFVDALAARLHFDAPSPEDDDYEPPSSEEDASFERIPLPWFVKRRLMKVLLRDVHHYLFNATSTPRPGETYKVRDEIRRRFVEALERDAATNAEGRHIVVSHSMGTVIAYDCLKRVPGCPQVDALLTIGSPLGLDEIQDKLRPGWSRHDGFPRAKLSGGWTNVYDRLDPVAGFDPELANDYQREGSPIVDDIDEPNHGKWRHNIFKYLGGVELRSSLAQQLGVSWP